MKGLHSIIINTFESNQVSMRLSTLKLFIFDPWCFSQIIYMLQAFITSVFSSVATYMGLWKYWQFGETNMAFQEQSSPVHGLFYSQWRFEGSDSIDILHTHWHAHKHTHAFILVISSQKCALSKVALLRIGQRPCACHCNTPKIPELSYLALSSDSLYTDGCNCIK